MPGALVLALSSLCPSAARAQATDAEIRPDALRVFLDCTTFPCSSDYIRTEVGFVNWVRDRTLAQIHLIVTSNETAGGGRVYGLDFVGAEDLEGNDDRLTYFALGTDTEDEILAGLSQVIAAGLARYATLIGQPASFTITSAIDAGRPTDEIVGASEVDDPWDFWVFDLGAEFELEGEESERRREYSGQAGARRTTETWKTELEWFGSFSRDERDLQDGTVIVDDRTNWSAGSLVAYALADHWSVGLIGGAGASTRRNEAFGAEAAAAAEYSFFPYAEAPRQSLTARYDLGGRYFDWEEETIFFEQRELRPQHRLRLELFQRQPWGESRVSIDGRQFLHDVGLWSVTLSGDLEFRITRGVDLEIRGDLDLIEDQIFLSRSGLTDEEILLGRFQRPTDLTYEISVGLGFEFGSIFNNVVNNRFRDGFGF